MSIEHGRSETLFCRDRIGQYLLRLGFRLVSDGIDPADGWRAEYLGGSEGDLVLLAQKADGTPFAVLETTVPAEPPGTLDALLAIVEATSDHDVSFYFAETGACHLSDRIFTSALNEADFGFHVENLLFCRETVAELTGAHEL